MQTAIWKKSPAAMEKMLALVPHACSTKPPATAPKIAPKCTTTDSRPMVAACCSLGVSRIMYGYISR
jgi:hypothetical protein